LVQWEGQTNSYDDWPSKGKTLKTMQVAVKRKNEKRCKEKEGRTIA